MHAKARKVASDANVVDFDKTIRPKRARVIRDGGYTADSRPHRPRTGVPLPFRAGSSGTITARTLADYQK